MASSDEQSAEPVRGGRHAPGEAAPPASAAVVKRATLVLRAYRSESAIYGVVLVSSLIAIGWHEDTDLEVLGFTFGAVIVFWLAHVYAGTVSREETGSPRLRAVLAVIGWYTAMRRGGHWGWWLLSALITASLGLLVTWLGSLVH